METRETILERIAALIDRGMAFELLTPGDTGLLKIEPALIENLDELLGSAVHALGSLSETLETMDENTPGISAATLSPEELADLAFLGRTELRQRRAELERAVGLGNGWTVAAESERAAARAVRALVPVEAALREQLGLDPRPRRYFDLEDALAIRRRFVELFLTGHRHESAEDDELGAALRLVAKRIDSLRSANIYPYLRVDDRLQIRALQKRIQAELESTERDLDARRRLFEDAVAFFDLLMQINRREELREHDWRQVARLAREMATPGAPDPVPADVEEELRDLAAQEPTLDALLLRREPIRPSEVAGPLAILRNRLESGRD